MRMDMSKSYRDKNWGVGGFFFFKKQKKKKKKKKVTELHPLKKIYLFWPMGGAANGIFCQYEIL